MAAGLRTLLPRSSCRRQSPRRASLFVPIGQGPRHGGPPWQSYDLIGDKRRSLKIASTMGEDVRLRPAEKIELRAGGKEVEALMRNPEAVLPREVMVQLLLQG